MDILASVNLFKSMNKKNEPFAPYRNDPDGYVVDTVSVLFSLLSLLISVYAAVLAWRCHRNIFTTALAFLFSGVYILIYLFTGGKLCV